jgi:glyoxylase-like metal-dependent hydrolase (beta-lactamase superfamily II)
VAKPTDYLELVALDRSRLHVFVAGPGQGEAVAIALPVKGWVLVDSCRAAHERNGTDLPLVSIVRRFRNADDPVEALILTHPHRDHSDGFAELVDTVKPGRIGIVGLPAPCRNLLDEADEWIASQARTTGIDRARLGAVKGALTAVREWTRAHAGALLVLRDGVPVPTPGSPAQVTAIEQLKSC